jgi:hypothetical protein
MKVPSTTTLSFPTLSPLLTAGKNIVGYFLDSPRRLLVGSAEGRRPLKDPGVAGRIILKWIFKKWDGGHGLD